MNISSKSCNTPISMINRIGRSHQYRYGFNGKEKDNEVKGTGNSYDFGARMQDPRLGRWLAVDPFFNKFPSHSPYIFAVNSPLVFTDSDGRMVDLKDFDAKQQEVIKNVFNSILSGSGVKVKIVNNIVVFEQTQKKVASVRDKLAKEVGAGTGYSTRAALAVVLIDIIVDTRNRGVDKRNILPNTFIGPGAYLTIDNGVIVVDANTLELYSDIIRAVNVSKSEKVSAQIKLEYLLKSDLTRNMAAIADALPKSKKQLKIDAKIARKTAKAAGKENARRLRNETAGPDAAEENKKNRTSKSFEDLAKEASRTKSKYYNKNGKPKKQRTKRKNRRKK